MLLGLGTSFVVPTAGKARVTALWSDFLSFQSRVQADPDGERILNYGGENEQENFSILVDRLFRVNDTSLATALGLAIAGLAGTGLALDFKRTKKHEPDGARQPDNPPVKL